MSRYIKTYIFFTNEKTDPEKTLLKADFLWQIISRESFLKGDIVEKKEITSSFYESDENCSLEKTQWKSKHEQPRLGIDRISAPEMSTCYLSEYRDSLYLVSLCQYPLFRLDIDQLAWLVDWIKGHGAWCSNWTLVTAGVTAQITGKSDRRRVSTLLCFLVKEGVQFPKETVSS